MSEATMYAEMLEIPATTVNVERKRAKRKDVKSEAIGTANERANTAKTTVFHDAQYAGNDFTPPVEQTEEEAVLPQKTHPVLLAEFAVAGLLAVGIFLTNVFLPDSAINTFIRSSLNVAPAETSKTYRDFDLSGVVSEYADVEVDISDLGVLTFTAQASVYPAVDGTVTAVERSGEEYVVTIEHAPAFQSVFTGLDRVYFAKGDAVRSNVPLGYTDGAGEVKVSFYESGKLLSDYSVGAKNCLSWNDPA